MTAIPCTKAAVESKSSMQLKPGRGISIEEAVLQAQLLEEASCVG